MSALLGTVLTAGDGHVRTASDPARPHSSAASPPATPVPPATPAPPRPAGIAGPPPPSSAWCLRKYGLACYSPEQIQRAYDLPSLYARGLDGRGRTIVVVDSFGSPTIRHDLRVFDAACGLPGPPSLRVLRPVGPVPPYNAKNPDMVDAAGETTSDVEAAHAIAPGASILLVETPAAVTRGGNTVRFIQDGKTVTVSGYRAGPGYNLATGIGTVDAARFIEDLRLLRASCPAGEDDHGRGRCLR